MSSFAYLFERFPAVTQTFCYREVAGVIRGGVTPTIFSIRRPAEIPRDCPAQITKAVCYLPEENFLRAEIKALLRERKLGRKATHQLTHGPQADRLRIYEALWLGPRLRAAGIRHVHAHFAGIAARTAYWLKHFYGITYSFTAHANDIFCEEVSEAFPVTHIDLIREASLVITVTDYSARWLQDRYPEWAPKIHRVYNGIDLSQIPETNDLAGIPHIVSVGRCIEKKGFKDLIDACALLRDRGLKFECSIIGDGPLMNSLQARIEKHRLTESVRLTGAKPQEEVKAILARSHIFALACATEADGGMDNLPTVIAEAMAAGLPVVSTRLAGVPEMVEENLSGFLVEEGDPTAFAAALEVLITNPTKGREFGAYGNQLVRERFEISVTAGSLLNLIRGLPKMPWLQRLRRAVAV